MPKKYNWDLLLERSWKFTKILFALIVFGVLCYGYGTFKPNSSSSITKHEMHEESYYISEDTASRLNRSQRKKNIIAVGTTSVRAIETAFQDEPLAFKGETSLFIYPGYKFKVVDHMITNFLLPKSSLLMLVAAFIGYEKMMDIYKTAVEKEYRFLSYGDAMLLKYHEV